MRFAAIDLPRHGSPTIVTTRGARSGHGDVVCNDPFVIESVRQLKENYEMTSLVFLYKLN